MNSNVKAVIATAKQVSKVGSNTYEASFRSDEAARQAAIALRSAGCTGLAAYSARFGEDAFVQFTLP
jgi:hypothetical protein